MFTAKGASELSERPPATVTIPRRSRVPSPPSTMQLNNKYTEPIERIELLRFFWWIPLSFIVYLWGIVMCIFSLIHFFQILITAKRDKKIHAQIGYFFKYQWQWTLYTLWMDDTLPNWNPFEFIAECEKEAKKK